MHSLDGSSFKQKRPVTRIRTENSLSVKLEVFGGKKQNSESEETPEDKSEEVIQLRTNNIRSKKIKKAKGKMTSRGNGSYFEARKERANQKQLSMEVSRKVEEKKVEMFLEMLGETKEDYEPPPSETERLMAVYSDHFGSPEAQILEKMMGKEEEEKNTVSLKTKEDQRHQKLLGNADDPIELEEDFNWTVKRRISQREMNNIYQNRTSVPNPEIMSQKLKEDIEIYRRISADQNNNRVCVDEKIDQTLIHLIGLHGSSIENPEAPNAFMVSEPQVEKSAAMIENTKTSFPQNKVIFNDPFFKRSVFVFCESHFEPLWTILTHYNYFSVLFDYKRFKMLLKSTQKPKLLENRLGVSFVTFVAWLSTFLKQDAFERAFLLVAALYNFTQESANKSKISVEFFYTVFFLEDNKKKSEEEMNWFHNYQIQWKEIQAKVPKCFPNENEEKNWESFLLIILGFYVSGHRLLHLIQEVHANMVTYQLCY